MSKSFPDNVSIALTRLTDIGIMREIYTKVRGYRCQNCISKTQKKHGSQVPVPYPRKFQKEQMFLELDVVSDGWRLLLELGSPSRSYKTKYAFCTLKKNKKYDFNTSLINLNHVQIQ
jgi:hypothetical protein